MRPYVKNRRATREVVSPALSASTAELSARAQADGCSYQYGRPVRIVGRQQLFRAPRLRCSNLFGSTSLLQGGRDVGDLLNQPLRPRDGPEAVVLIEPDGVRVDSIDDDEASRNSRRRFNDATKSIGEQSSAELLTRHRLVERQTRKKHDRNLFWDAVSEGSRQLILHDELRAYRVAAAALVIAGVPYKGASGSPGSRA